MCRFIVNCLSLIYLGTVVVFGVSVESLCSANEIEATREAYEEHVYSDESGKRLGYRLLKPVAIDSGTQYPAVLFLHGAGARGQDNLSQLKTFAALMARRDYRLKYPAFVIVPQCPFNQNWTSHIDVVLGLLEEIIKSNPIDRNRIYLTGYSMGAFGCWEIAAQSPDLFAAVVPVAGRSIPSLASHLTELPLWLVHGDADNVVSVDQSRQMVDALHAAGGNPIYTEAKGVGHRSWRIAYGSDGVLNWMFAQSRRWNWLRRNWGLILLGILDVAIIIWLGRGLCNLYFHRKAICSK